MKSDMMRRIEADENVAGRRDAIAFIGIILMLLGVIVLGHNTIYGSDPQLVGIVANTPVLVVPISNLIIGGLLFAAGTVTYRQRG